MLEVFEMVARVQDSNHIVHELECIAVAGEHESAVLFTFTHGRQSADDVIAFKPGLFDIGDTERGEHLLNQRQLGQQILRCRFARAFVLRQQIIAERTAFDIERDGEFIGMLGLDDLREHLGEAPDRVRRLTARGREVLDGKGEIRAERERVSVNDEQGAAEILLRGTLLSVLSLGVIAHRRYPASDRRTSR